MRTLSSVALLARGVMVALQILTLAIEVRVLAGEPIGVLLYKKVVSLSHGVL